MSSPIGFRGFDPEEYRQRIGTLPSALNIT